MNSLIDRDPNVHGGDLVLKGTRLPLKHLWDYLEADYSVEEYAEQFEIDPEKVRPIAEFLRGDNNR